MKTSTQVLAIVLANLHAVVSEAQTSVDALLAHEQTTQEGKTGPLPLLSDTAPPQGDATPYVGSQRVLDVFNPQPDMDRIALAVSPTQHAALKAQSALFDASQVITQHWRKRGHKTINEGTLQHYNAVLTLALGPDAPQFVPHGDGWALVAGEGNNDLE